MDVMNEWMQSGLPALIRGLKVFPLASPSKPNIAFREQGDQGKAFYLKAKKQYILKIFLSDMQPPPLHLNGVAQVVPRGAHCNAAHKRIILNARDLKKEKNFYFSFELAAMLENSILMPRMKGKSWKKIAYSLRKGQETISPYRRFCIAESLADLVCDLEEKNCAHRDLSPQNLYIHPQEYVASLVDWDSLYHKSFSFSQNTPLGTQGYIPHWIQGKKEKWDIQKTWQPKSDRFALGILITEILLVSKNAPSYHEGSLFSQDMYKIADHTHITRCLKAMKRISLPLGQLLYETISARSFEYPDPKIWQKNLKIMRKRAENLDPSFIPDPLFDPEDAEEEIVSTKIIPEEILLSEKTSPKESSFFEEIPFLEKKISPKENSSLPDEEDVYFEEEEKNSYFSVIHYILIALIALAAFAFWKVYQKKHSPNASEEMAKIKENLAEEKLAKLQNTVVNGKTTSENASQNQKSLQAQKPGQTPKQTNKPKTATNKPKTKKNPAKINQSPTKTNPPLIPLNPEPAVGTRLDYSIQILYPYPDLILLIDQQKIEFAQPNLAHITLETGTHAVTLIYTSQNNVLMEQTKMIVFGKKTEFVFQVNRENAAWYKKE